MTYNFAQEKSVYDPKQIANWFIEHAHQSGQALTLPLLMKLVYLSQAWHLEMLGYPLIRATFEAWRSGPVIPALFEALRKQGVVISAHIPNVGHEVTSSRDEYLREIYRIYANAPRERADDLILQPGGAWDLTKRYDGLFGKISNKVLRAQFNAKRQTNTQAAAA